MATIPNVKVWTRSEIHQLLAQNDAAVVKALLNIFDRQTSAEKNRHTTVEDNNRGFTAPDAPLMSIMAEKHKQYGYLTVNQLAAVRARMPKYWRQLLQIAEAKGAKVSYNPKA